MKQTEQRYSNTTGGFQYKNFTSIIIIGKVIEWHDRNHIIIKVFHPNERHGSTRKDDPVSPSNEWIPIVCSNIIRKVAIKTTRTCKIRHQKLGTLIESYTMPRIHQDWITIGNTLGVVNN